MKILNIITFALVIIGALNWMLFGIMQVNLVGSIFGTSEILVKFVYFLIGMSGLYMLTHYKDLTTEK